MDLGLCTLAQAIGAISLADRRYENQDENPMIRTRFLGTGLAVPDRVVTNDELSQLMDTTDEWIRTRTGIQERRWIKEGETGTEMGLQATQRALDMAGLKAGDIDA